MESSSDSSNGSVTVSTNGNYFVGTGSDDHNDDDNSSVYESPSTVDVIFDPAKGISEPDPNDVICGRGKMTSLHPANRRFRELVNQHKDSYQKAKRRDEKTQITCDLVDMLRNEGRYATIDLLGTCAYTEPETSTEL